MALRDASSRGVSAVEPSFDYVQFQKDKLAAQAKKADEEKAKKAKQKADFDKLFDPNMKAWQKDQIGLSDVALSVRDYYANIMTEAGAYDVTPEQMFEMEQASSALNSLSILSIKQMEEYDAASGFYSGDREGKYSDREAGNKAMLEYSNPLTIATPDDIKTADEEIMHMIPNWDQLSEEQKNQIRKPILRKNMFPNTGEDLIKRKASDISYVDAIKKIGFTPGTKTSIETGFETVGGKFLDLTKFKAAVDSWYKNEPVAKQLYEQAKRANPNLTEDDFKAQVVEDRGNQFQEEYSVAQDEGSKGMSLVFGAGGGMRGDELFATEPEEIAPIGGGSLVKSATVGLGNATGGEVEANAPVYWAEEVDANGDKTGRWVKKTNTAGTMLMSNTKLQFRGIDSKTGKSSTTGSWYLVGVGPGFANIIVPYSNRLEQGIITATGLTKEDIQALQKDALKKAGVKRVKKTTASKNQGKSNGETFQDWQKRTGKKSYSEYLKS